MLQSELNHLSKCAKKIQSATIGIQKKLEKLFDQGYRSFEVCIGDNIYLIQGYSTLQEKQQQDDIRKKVISELLKISFNNFVDNLHDDAKTISYWDDILFFAMGHPAEHYQIEKIFEKDSVEISDSNEKRGELDINSPYLIWQNDLIDETSKQEIVLKRLQDENIKED